MRLVGSLDDNLYALSPDAWLVCLGSCNLVISNDLVMAQYRSKLIR